MIGRPEGKPFDEKEFGQLIEKAEIRAGQLMPGKTLGEISEMYRQFYSELRELREDAGCTIEDIIACMDRYDPVLEIADMFPEQGKDSWADYRSSLRDLAEME